MSPELFLLAVFVFGLIYGFVLSIIAQKYGVFLICISATITGLLLREIVNGTSYKSNILIPLIVFTVGLLLGVAIEEYLLYKKDKENKNNDR